MIFLFMNKTYIYFYMRDRVTETGAAAAAAAASSFFDAPSARAATNLPATTVIPTGTLRCS